MEEIMNRMKMKIAELVMDNATLKEELDEAHDRLEFGRTVTSPVLRELDTVDDYFIGQYKIIGFTRHHEDEDGYAEVVVLEVISIVKDRGIVAKAIERTFTDESWCGHDYDCCGCVRTRCSLVWPTYNDNIYVAQITGTRNI